MLINNVNLRKERYNALFVVTTAFGFDRRGSRIALAEWAGLPAMPAAPFPLSIEYIFVRILLWYLAFSCIQGSFETLQLASNYSTNQVFGLKTIKEAIEWKLYLLFLLSCNWIGRSANPSVGVIPSRQKITLRVTIFARKSWC